MPRRPTVDPQFPVRLRQLRLERGMSLGQLQRVAFVSRSHLSELERGIKTPSARIAQALDGALSADGQLAALVRDATQEPAQTSDPPQEAADAAWWEVGGTNDLIDMLSREDLMDRRNAARTVAGMAVGAALLEPLDRWMGGVPPDPMRPVSGGVRVGDQEMAELEHVAGMFRAWNNQFGGGLQRGAVIGQLNAVSGLLEHTQSAQITRRLYRVLTQLAETVATMSWDTGDAAGTQRYYLLALRAAGHADDHAFAANILASMARQLLYMGHVGDATELVRLAQNGAAGRATARVQAMLFTREAWAYAKQGRVTAFRRATDRAHDALEESAPGEDPQWISYFDAAELAGTTGGRLLELAHRDRRYATEAAEQIEHALATRVGAPLRSMSLDRVGAAEARLLQDEAEEAVRLGHLAVGTVEQTTSDRARVKLAEFYQLTRPLRRQPAMAELRDRMRPLLAA